MKNKEVPPGDDSNIMGNIASDENMIYSYSSNIADKPYIIGGEDMIKVTPTYQDAKDYDGVSFEDIDMVKMEKELLTNSKGYRESKEESSITREAAYFSMDEEEVSEDSYDSDHANQDKFDENQRVANMNVEGMPWYTKEVDEDERLRRLMEPTLTRKETRHLIFNAMLAALSVGFVFLFGLFLFILFCTKVWFV